MSRRRASRTSGLKKATSSVERPSAIALKQGASSYFASSLTLFVAVVVGPASFTSSRGRISAPVRIVQGSSRRYLRTDRNSITRNNLDYLPES